MQPEVFLASPQSASRTSGMHPLTFRYGDRPPGSCLAAESLMARIMHSELVVVLCIHSLLTLALRIIPYSTY
jgi:hypothetical protein